MNGDRLLVVMAKAPRAGNVKSRLLQSHPDGVVMDLYRSLVEDTLAMAQSIPDLRVAVMCPAGDALALRAWLGDHLDIVEQSGVGLANGLRSTFDLFAVRPSRRIIAFNSDSPHLPPRVVEAAFEALQRHDLVIGPTDDGGYYLIGARQPHPGLFDSSLLGTGRALDALVTRAQERQLSVAYCQTWYDIDVGEDVERLRAELDGSPERAPRTAALLASLNVR